MKILRYIPIGALALALFVGRPIDVQAQGGVCLTLSSVMERVMMVQGVKPYADLVGKDAAVFMAAYNAVEPVTDHRSDHVLAVIHPTEPAVYVIMLSAGCVDNHGAMPLADFEEYRFGGKPA